MSERKHDAYYARFLGPLTPFHASIVSSYAVSNATDSLQSKKQASSLTKPASSMAGNVRYTSNGHHHDV